MGMVASTLTLCCQRRGGWERSLTMRVGGGEGKQVGWGATDRLCHCLIAPPAALLSLRCTWGMGTWWYRGGVGCRG